MAIRSDGGGPCVGRRWSSSADHGLIADLTMPARSADLALFTMNTALQVSSLDAEALDHALRAASLRGANGAWPIRRVSVPRLHWRQGRFDVDRRSPSDPA